MAKFTTDSQKSQILTLKNVGIPSSLVAYLTKVDRSTVNRIYHRYLKPCTTYPAALRTRCPQKMTARDDRLAVMGLAKLWAGNATQLQRIYFPDLHPETIRHYLKVLGFASRQRQKVPCLTYKQRKARREWAMEHSSWDIGHWDRVIFSDASKFNIFTSDGIEYVWRRPGQAYDPCYTRKTVQHGGGSVMVWGCITYEGIGRLHRIQGTMNAAIFTDILKDALVGTLSDRKLRPRSLIFQRDNDPKHKSKMASGFLKSIHLPVLPWPSNSPDMNIIEHVWSYLDRKVRSRTILPNSEDNLWVTLKEEWENIDEILIKNLYHSMPRRVAEFCKADGGNTKY
ncbi:hypothetical protein OPQ81_000705 [Rhizoctonia solani]|nr:hypothetical protein OPQ81_000705 [Rhizoctonia solani]